MTMKSGQFYGVLERVVIIPVHGEACRRGLACVSWEHAIVDEEAFPAVAVVAHSGHEVDERGLVTTRVVVIQPLEG
jgi:hypothetical protein